MEPPLNEFNTRQLDTECKMLPKRNFNSKIQPNDLGIRKTPNLDQMEFDLEEGDREFRNVLEPFGFQIGSERENVKES